MNTHRNLIGTFAGLVLGALLATFGATAAPAAHGIAKPGFGAGTWTGKGTLTAAPETAGGHTVRAGGSFDFTISVSKDGQVTGTGTWKIVQVGSGGDMESKTVMFAAVRFGGTATNVTYSGTQKMTTRIVAYGRVPFTSTKSRPYNGRLAITRAGHCRVVGGHTNGGATVKWAAVLKGSGTCLT